jgi:NitT/TauT family transport system substrate-binding protein
MSAPFAPIRRILHLVPILAILACAGLWPWTADAKVRVGLSDWPGWVAWYIAKDKGFFAKYGADVELVWFPNYTDSIQALSAGQVDANSQTWSDTLAPLAQGVPIQIVLVNDNSAGNDAVLATPAITSMSALKGKNVALEAYSVSHFVLATALKKNRMAMNDVNVVNLSAGDAAAAFLGGRVDGVVVWNPWVNQIQVSGKGKALFTSKDMPGLIPDCLVATTKSIQSNRADYLGMIRAWYDVEKFLREKPEESAAIMAKVVGLEVKDYLPFLKGTRFFNEADNLKAFGPASDPVSLLGVGPEIAAFLTENKLLEGKVDFAKGLDGSLVKDVAKK